MVRVSCIDPSKDPADNERVVSCLYAGKQGFRPGRSQPEAAQGTSYQKPKTPRICPAIFDEACNGQASRCQI